MMPQHTEELLATLRQKPLSLEEAYDRARSSGSAWSTDQLELFLLCAPGVERNEDGSFQVASSDAQDAFHAALVEAVRSFAGKPASAAQVRTRLPNHFVTTDEQVLAVARRIVGLEVFGPKLIRITA